MWQAQITCAVQVKYTPDREDLTKEKQVNFPNNFLYLLQVKTIIVCI